MIIYFFIILLTCFLAFLSSKCSNYKVKNLLMIVVFIILFLFSAIRYDVGYDYSYTYLPGYYKIVNGTATHFEPFFILLNIFVYRVFNNVDWVFVICSFITLFMIYKYIKHQSSNYFVSVVMLFATRFYFYSFTQIRQYISIAIFLYSIKYIISKDFKKYFFNIFLACLFHKTAILYFPIYFLNRISLTRKQFLLIFFAAPLFSPLFNKIYSIIGYYFYSNYISSTYGIGNSSIVLLASAFIFTVITIFYIDKLRYEKKTNVYVNLQLLLWVLIVSISSINESYRIFGMFMYSSIILMSNCYKLSNKNLKILLAVIFLGMAVYSSYLMLVYPGGKMIPYKTVFNK